VTTHGHGRPRDDVRAAFDVIRFLALGALHETRTLLLRPFRKRRS
jgi:hypothetical protein